MNLNRLFFALWPDDAVRDQALEAARELKVEMQPGGHLSKREMLHVTLAFLGKMAAAPLRNARKR